MKSTTCPKCGGRMSSGTLLSKDSYGAQAAASWIEGEPKRSIWTGLKTKGLKILPVISMRCGGCGYLENYTKGR